MSRQAMIDRVMIAISDEKKRWKLFGNDRWWRAYRTPLVTDFIAHQSVPSTAVVTHYDLYTDEKKSRDLFQFMVDKACAKAAIEAMREPTGSMLGRMVHDLATGATIAQAYQAMFDRFLET